MYVPDFRGARASLSNINIQEPLGALEAGDPDASKNRSLWVTDWHTEKENLYATIMALQARQERTKIGVLKEERVPPLNPVAEWYRWISDKQWEPISNIDDADGAD
jgi:hypothetical protein